MSLNLIMGAWAAVLSENEARLIPLIEYLDLSLRLAELDRDEGDKNIWYGLS